MDVKPDNYLARIAIRIRAGVEPSSTIPPGDVDELFYAYAVLALAKGESVTPADVHNAWVAWMLPREPQHEALVPFEELDQATARSDEPFAEAVREVARELHLESGAVQE